MFLKILYQDDDHAYSDEVIISLRQYLQPQSRLRQRLAALIFSSPTTSIWLISMLIFAVFGQWNEVRYILVYSLLIIGAALVICYGLRLVIWLVQHLQR